MDDLPIRNLGTYKLEVVLPTPKVQIPERIAMRPELRDKINKSLARIFGSEYTLPLGQCYIDNVLGYIYVRPEDYPKMAKTLAAAGIVRAAASIGNKGE